MDVLLNSSQSNEWRLKGETKPKRPRQSRLKVKLMLVVFFYCCGVVYINSYQLTSQSIKIISWVFCAVCMKQVVKNGLKRGRNPHGFCSKITCFPQCNYYSSVFNWTFNKYGSKSSAFTWYGTVWLFLILMVKIESSWSPFRVY